MILQMEQLSLREVKYFAQGNILEKCMNMVDFASGSSIFLASVALYLTRRKKVPVFLGQLLVRQDWVLNSPKDSWRRMRHQEKAEKTG